MGAPVSDMRAAEQQAAETLFSAFKTIAAPERRRHASVYNYWLSIRGDREFPTIRDLDPLQISDAGPCSVLLQLIDGGQDAEIRHLGETLKSDVEVDRISDAPRRSLLSCVAGKLAIVAISRDALAFEDEFETAAGTVRCRTTLLPFGSAGPFVDYVYGFITLEGASSDAEAASETIPDDEGMTEMPAEPAEELPEMILDQVEETPEPGPSDAEQAEQTEQGAPEPFDPAPEPAAAESSAESPAASAKGFDPLAGAEGFFGTVVSGDPELVTSSVAQEKEEGSPMAEPQSVLQSRLAEARAKADEARLAKLQSEAALQAGVSAAYDFALDAEEQPEEYLKLVETRGLKIQLRSPMTPVVKLAFEGLCDESTIAELEAVLAWALKMNLPRGSLAERIAAEGGIESLLNGEARQG